MKKALTFGILSTAIAVAGCTPQADRAAGSDLDIGGFGNSTMNNHLVHTGQRNAAIELSRKFAAEAPTTINFAFNSAALDASARAALDQQASWIARYPTVRFRVYGHTDLVGSAGYNKALGLRRARAAVNYLVSRGISRSRLEAVASFGETQPLIHTQDRERRNRRTVTEVSGFMGKRPSFQDGKYALFSYTETITSATEPHELVIIDEQGSDEER
ncbi:OmpA family protein [Vannielia litorea]|uniref:OmpA family protein n=1 Tax=Vannielia TaxID=2813041 RepID=UPI001C97E2E5|nr:OmpA family protein [Vannielia litorea]MBY6048162.1 OmpA family protein [Vannielia litorea]MBY6075576.1 OmpA family protein [Vannielia litorea]MBY6151936.1 OmpA family protein [Vannielia litorea]